MKTLPKITLVFLATLLPQKSIANSEQPAYKRVIETGTIRCGYVPWTSFFERDIETNELTGLYKEVFDKVFKLLNLDVKYIEVTLGQTVQDLNSGKIDAMCGDGPWVISTAKYINYSTPIAYFPIYAFVRNDESRFNKLEDLNQENIKFVGIDGDLSTELVSLKFPKAQTKTLSVTSPAGQMFLELAGNKADVVITDPITASEYMANTPNTIKQLNTDLVAAYPGGM